LPPIRQQASTKTGKKKKKKNRKKEQVRLFFLPLANQRKKVGRGDSNIKKFLCAKKGHRENKQKT